MVFGVCLIPGIRARLQEKTSFTLAGVFPDPRTNGDVPLAFFYILFGIFFPAPGVHSCFLEHPCVQMWVPQAEITVQRWHGEASLLWNLPQTDRQHLGCDLWREEERSWWKPDDPGQLLRNLQTSTEL